MIQTQMITPTTDITEWRNACGLPCGHMDDPADLNLHMSLIREEYDEFREALVFLNRNWGDRLCREHVAKEATDLVYVLVGLLTHLGISFDTAWTLVHRSNMTKLVDGKIQRRPDGKIQKGPRYQPPNLKEAVL